MIEKSCRYTPSGNEKFILLPKIYAHIESNQGKDLYLVGNNALLSKEEVIEWISTHRLDGVLVHQNDRSIYIRSRPTYTMWNIHMPANGLPPLECEIDTLMRIVGEKRIAYYEELLEKISNVTILDPGPEYEHSFCNDCYQKEVKTITERYKEKNSNPMAIVSVNLMDYATV